MGSYFSVADARKLVLTYIFIWRVKKPIDQAKPPLLPLQSSTDPKKQAKQKKRAMVVGTVISSILSMGSKLVAAMNSSASSSSTSGEFFGSIKKALDNLEKRLLRIQAILADAEEREIRDESVKLWLKELKYLAYEAEDVLEEYQYEVQRLEIVERRDADHTPLKRKREQDEGDQVRDLTSALINLSIPEKIIDISDRFDEISRDRVVLQLTENDGPRRPCLSATPQPTTSLVDESGVFGREDDKEMLIEMLLSDELGKLSVIPIVGMGGLGKTTLAKVVYNDPRVQQHFNCKVWVCVSEDFDVARLNTEIYESITRGRCMEQPDALQATLREEVEGKKVLVVLDDVWNEKQSPWEWFRVSFLAAEKVRFIVTTRNDSVAEVMQTVPAYHLGYLLEAHCYSLFRHHAFGSQDPEQHPELVDIGRSIVQKCRGLPLAIKTLGGLLHYEMGEERWTEILESDLWDLDEMKNEILPALKLSYHRMPSHLKPCFLYSSVFPKDYCFEKDKLVKLWMAQGYIQPRGNKRLEDIGSDYFHELRRRSFFQSADTLGFPNTFASPNTEGFVLHDTIHDLARTISGSEHCAVILKHNEKVCPISTEVRHLYVKCLQGATIDQMPLESTKGLRTLIVENHFENATMTNDQLYVHLGGLRALEIKHSTFPDSIGKLKHLRYLYGSHNNRGERLPPVGHLYNLQSLDLTHKRTFVNCASDIKYLFNLRHLILRVPFMKHPLAEWFFAENPDMFSADSNNLSNSGCPRGMCYASFSKLVEIRLSGIIGWNSLSPLGQLQSLKSLTIYLMYNIQRVGREFYCCGCVNSVNASLVTNSIGFPFLEELKFGNMPIWEEWSGVTNKDFPRLRKLTLANCPKLKGLPTGFLSLQTLYVSGCKGLKSLFMNQDTGCSIELREVTSVAWLHNLTSLRLLHVKNCSEFQLLPGEQLPSELLELHLVGCHKLELLPEQHLPSKLQELHLAHCHKLELSPEQQLPSGLETVHISDCWNLKSIPGVQNLTSLKSFKAKRCPHICLSPQEELPSKPQHVKITDCPRLRDWCQRHNFDCTQKISLMEELSTYWIGRITECLGVDNLASLKKLFLFKMYQSHLSLGEQLPPSLQMLKVSCRHLESLSLDQNVPSLKSIFISGCHKLTSVIGLKNLPYLENLEIRECHELQFSPDEHLASSLKSLQVSDCKGLRPLPLLHENLSALEKLEVSNCSELTILAGICNLSSLQTLILSRCPVLSISPDELLPATPSHVFISHCPALMEWCGQQRIPYDQSPFGTQETGNEEESDNGVGSE